jgi:cytochrome c biogenesis protein CcmG, thiol:disulfide interchange protein DsbE
LKILEKKTFQILIVVLAGVWITVSTLFIEHQDNQVISAAMEGFQAPDFLIEDVDGDLTGIEQYRGQVVLLNLWASWCTPCRAEMPAMERAYQALKDQGFTILAVNMTMQDDKNQAIAFAKELGLSFPLLFDTEGEVQQKYALQALPTSFFIDRNGIIRAIIVGGPMPESLVYSRAQELLEEN